MAPGLFAGLGCILALSLSGCSSSDSPTNPPTGAPSSLRAESPPDMSYPPTVPPKITDMVVKFNNIVDAKTFAWDRVSSRTFGFDCPPLTVSVLDDTRSVIDRQMSSVIQGSMTSLYSTKDKKLMVKVAQDSEILSTLWRDQAALWVLNDLKIAPRIFDPKYQYITDECRARSYVMERVGDRTLADLFDEGRVTGPKQVAQIGIAMIDLIEKVHSRGLLHGDIYGPNFVFSDENDVAGSLRIVDFGRAKPYIDPQTGAHITDGFAEFDPYTWNTVYLSVNELNDKAVSRRDDMFRIAELLVFLTDGERGLVKFSPGGNMIVPPIRQLVKLKRNRQFSSAVSQQVIDVYYKSLGMGFAEEPDYEMFRQILASV